MEIRSVRHKGLRRFMETGGTSGLPAAHVDKIRKMLTVLSYAPDAGGIREFPAWRAHVLTGNRKGTWALHVSPNWRLTFRVDPGTSEIIDLDLEDYH